MPSNRLWHFLLWFLAYFRLSKKAVCLMSEGEADYHDYRDESDLCDAWHGYVYHCSRCGKGFTI